jgi:hypothetical protein
MMTLATARPSLPVQAFADPADELALRPIQTGIGFTDHEDVLLAPTALLDRFDVRPPGLKTRKRTPIG